MFSTCDVYIRLKKTKAPLPRGLKRHGVAVAVDRQPCFMCSSNISSIALSKKGVRLIGLKDFAWSEGLFLKFSHLRVA